MTPPARRGFGLGGGDRVGELVGVQNCAAARGPAHDLKARGGDGGMVDLGIGLVASQADGRRLPLVETQRGQAVAGRTGFGDSLVDRHIGRARARLVVDDEPPHGGQQCLGRLGLDKDIGPYGRSSGNSHWVFAFDYSSGRNPGRHVKSII